MVLHASHFAFLVFESCDRRTFGGRGDYETFWGFRDGVAVAHPHLVAGLEAFVEDATGNVDVGASVFALTGVGNGATKRVGHGLEAVANAKYWQSEI